MTSLADAIDAHAQRAPDAPAFHCDGDEVSYGAYAARSDRVAAFLAGASLARGDRVAVLLPDTPDVHVALVGAEKAGLVAMGIGPRAGPQEIRHLLRVSGARALVTRPTHAGRDTCGLVAALRDEGLPLDRHIVVEEPFGEPGSLHFAGGDPAGRAVASADVGPRLARDEVFLLNSTSGTTGMPKCVVHDQARWFYFHGLAVDAGEMTGRDVFLSAIPAPFGFGIWTSHVTPALLGAPTVIAPRFDADATLARIERHRVSVLAAVSTQFVMMLNSPEMARRDLSSLRVLFTGGEAVPTERAAEFEERTGARVLQFYGSNETGALSRTTLRDSRDVRLRSAGRIIADMHVRLFDADGKDVTDRGEGQPGCRGPALSRGYFRDDAANARLYTPDGWMLTGDVATLEGDVLRVVGRASDFIIRGGKNVSAAAVEQAVARHPAVALAAAVAMPDPVFGERVCACVELRDGADLTLSELLAFLEGEGVSKETWPERLVAMAELPRGSGGKVAKQALRDDVRRRFAPEARE